MGELDVEYEQYMVNQRIADFYSRNGIPPSFMLEKPPGAPDPESEGGFLRSIGEFLKEVPSQTISGIGDAANNALELAKEIGIAAGIPDIGIQLKNEKGEFDVGLFGPGEERTAKVVPVAKKARTGGGQALRSLVTFATGFIPASKALKGIGLASGITRAAAAGGISAGVTSDPHEMRLATLLNEVPGLNKVIPDYLADNDPANEGKWEGRLKNAIDAAAGSAITDAGVVGIVKVFKGYKAARLAKASDVVAKTKKPKIKSKNVEELAKRVGKKDLPKTAPEVILNASPDKKFFINMNRIDALKEVKNVMQTAADIGMDPKKGAKTLKGIETASEAELNDLSKLLGRDVNRVFTPEEAVAARNLLQSASEVVSKLAPKATGVNADPKAIFEFRQSLALLNDIQDIVYSGRKATAQSLTSWRVKSKGSKKAEAEILEALGFDRDKIKEMAEIIVDTPEELVSATAKKLTEPTWKDAFYQLWMNNILSGPATHLANIIGNTGTTVGAISEKYIAGGIDMISGRGPQGFVEANAKAYGFLAGVKDAFKALKGTDESIIAGTKLENVAHPNAIMYKINKLNTDSYIGKGLTYMGKAVSLPGKALEKEDTFFKAINYRMALHEEAAIKANSEGLKGTTAKKRIAELVSNPTEPMTDAAVDFARVQTFTNPGGKVIQGFQVFSSTVPGSRYVLPFVRTPGNIFKYGFERTPIALAFSDTRKALMQGGIARSTAIAKMTSGSMIMAAATAYTLDGRITGAGPKNPAERQALLATGWQPYSFKFGDTYVSYARIEPYGSLIGYSADMASMIGSDDLSDEERENLVANGLAAFSKSFSQKTFTAGAVDLISAIEQGTAEGYERYLQGQATNIVPLSGAGKTVTRYFDDVKKDFRPDDTMGFLRATIERMKESTGVLSADAPPLRDIWGKPMSWSNGVVNSLEVASPIRIKKIEEDPVNRIIAEKGISISRPSRTIEGVKLTNKEYSEYARIVGETARKQMDKLQKSKKFLNLNKDQTQLIFDKVFDKSKDIARKKLIRSSLDLQGRIREKKLELAERITM